MSKNSRRKMASNFESSLHKVDLVGRIVPEKKTAICYGRVKKENKRWLNSQAKKLDTSVSSLLDVMLDGMRRRYPQVAKATKKAA